MAKRKNKLKTPPAVVETAEERQQLAMIPSGPGGIRGKVICRSTLMGAPIGFNPNLPAEEVIIDPDSRGGGYRVNPRSLTKEAVEKAIAEAGVGESATIEELRARAAEVYAEFAIDENQVDQPTEPKEISHSTTETPAVFSSPIQQPAKPVTTPGAPRASLFAKTKKTEGIMPQAQNTAVLPPNYKVTFEVEGSPVVVETWYHEVIRQDHVLVFCYDTRTVGFPRTRFRPTEEDIAVYIDGSDCIYVVTDPGISFTHGNDEIQVFLIKNEYPLAAVSG